MLDLHQPSPVITGCPHAAPLNAILALDEDNLGWIATDRDPDRAYGWYLHQGLRLGHWPGNDSVVLHLLGGTAEELGYEDEGFLARVSRDGLRQLIADLQAIDAALGAR